LGWLLVPSGVTASLLLTSSGFVLLLLLLLPQAFQPCVLVTDPHPLLLPLLLQISTAMLPWLASNG
jgi:hypothetical protein